MRGYVEAALSHLQDRAIFGFVVGMSELTPDSIAAVALAPVAVAPPLAEVLVDGQVDKLVFAMGESTLLAVVAVTKFGVGLAQLGLVLKRVCPNA